MATGQTGHHGDLVVEPVEEEIKLEQELVLIPHLLMVAKTVVPVILKLLYEFATI